MSTILYLIIFLVNVNIIKCEEIDVPAVLANSMEEKQTSRTDENGIIELGDSKYLPDPISSINIDYTNNALILHFRKAKQRLDGGSEKNKIMLDKNFMRFGRGDAALMRFGKRQAEFLNINPKFQNSADESRVRDSRGDNFMRFGRMVKNIREMKYPLDQKPDSLPAEYLEVDSKGPLAEKPEVKHITRLGRSENDNFLRFGRPENFIRFGRVFDRNKNLADDDNYIKRQVRNDKSFMRFGKLDQNFMRFGKRHGEFPKKLVDYKQQNLDDYKNFQWHHDGSNPNILYDL